MHSLQDMNGFPLGNIWLSHWELLLASIRTRIHFIKVFQPESRDAYTHIIALERKSLRCECASLVHQLSYYEALVEEYDYEWALGSVWRRIAGTCSL